MADVLIRRDIWSLEDESRWHPITEAYARAVATMQERGPDDPTGWAYQAAIHGSDVADDFRDQCQHNSWFFLPWHRMYLHWFELTVRAALQSLDEVPDQVKDTWALPYWNYDRGGDTASLPAAFLEPTLPDGSTQNPLFIRQRNPNVNRGFPLPTGPLGITSAARALNEGFFSISPLPGETVGFGGPVTRWHHFGENGAIPGALESAPHNGVHGAVGGRGGFMSAFDTAPLDPVFWLHHANIDRLWTVWLQQEDRENPTDQNWTDFEFDFHDETGAPLKSRVSGVLDTTQLGYAYDEVAVPVAARQPAERRPSLPSQPSRDRPPELVGATEERVELSGRQAKVSVPVEAPTGPAQRLGAEEGPSRIYLNVEGIEGDENPGLSYGVFINLPDDEDVDAEPESHHVGNVSFFGIERARDVERDHPGGHGLRYAFDITDLVRQLRDEGRWDPEQVQVTFSPVRVQTPEGEPEAEAAEGEPTVRIGRVGIYAR